MGTFTGISWTGATYNPWTGCHKVSQGCKHCYMYRDKKRYGQDPTAVLRSKPPTFNAPLKWQREAAQGTRQRHDRMVFTCSWSDFFIEEADSWRPEVWDIIRQTPLLTYQILTKRPERIAAHLPPDWGAGWPNCWLGVSAEDQATTTGRFQVLRMIPAAKLFLSYEPALAPVDLYRGGFSFLEIMRSPTGTVYRPLDWVVCGGESGPQSRPCNLAWLRTIVGQCQSFGVPVWVKQLGARPYVDLRLRGAQYTDHTFYKIHDRKGADPAEWPEDLRVQQFPHPREMP